MIETNLIDQNQQRYNGKARTSCVSGNVGCSRWRFRAKHTSMTRRLGFSRSLPRRKKALFTSENAQFVSEKLVLASCGRDALAGKKRL